MSDEVDIAHERNMAIIFAKIGGLMGLTWIFALVPYITGIREMWYIFTVLNGVQGVYVFTSSGIAAHFLKMKQSKIPKTLQEIKETK